MAAAVSSSIPFNLLQHQPTRSFRIQSHQSFIRSLELPKPASIRNSHHRFSVSPMFLKNPKERRTVLAATEETSVSTQDPLSESARKLYVGNIPRTVDNSKLKRIFDEHGAVEKAEDRISGELIGLAEERNGLYILDAKEGSSYSLSKSYLSSYSTNKEDIWLHHYRLGHPPFSLLKTMFPLLFKNIELLEGQQIRVNKA